MRSSWKHVSQMCYSSSLLFGEMLEVEADSVPMKNFWKSWDKTPRHCWRYQVTHTLANTVTESALPQQRFSEISKRPKTVQQLSESHSTPFTTETNPRICKNKFSHLWLPGWHLKKHLYLIVTHVIMMTLCKDLVQWHFGCEVFFLMSIFLILSLHLFFLLAGVKHCRG